MSSVASDDESRKRLPCVTEASVAAIIRLRSNFAVLKELIDLYENFDSSCKDVLVWASLSHFFFDELYAAMTLIARQGQEIDDVYEADFEAPDRLTLITLASNIEVVRRGVWNHFEVLSQRGSHTVWKAVGNNTVGALDTRSAAEEVVQERKDIVKGLGAAEFDMETFEVRSAKEVLRIAKQSRKDANDALIGELKKAMSGWERESGLAVLWMKQALLQESTPLRSHRVG